MRVGALFDVVTLELLRDGLFSILLRNIGPRPALVVKTTFEKPFTGLGGRKAITVRFPAPIRRNIP